MFNITALVKYFFALKDGNHGVIRGRSPLKDEWTILCRTAFLDTRKKKEPEDNVRIFLRCWKYKGGIMPLTFKPFINLAEAIALAKESGRPVLVKP